MRKTCYLGVASLASVYDFKYAVDLAWYYVKAWCWPKGKIFYFKCKLQPAQDPQSGIYPKESVPSPQGICFIAWSAFKPIHGPGLQWANVGNPRQAIFRYNTCDHPHPHNSNYNDWMSHWWKSQTGYFLDTTPVITLTLITVSTWLGLKQVAIWV